MANVKKTRNIVLVRMWRKLTCVLLVGMKIDAATMEKLWRVLKYLKTELSYDSAIPLLDIYAKITTTLTGNICAPCPCSLERFYNSHSVETTCFY